MIHRTRIPVAGALALAASAALIFAAPSPAAAQEAEHAAMIKAFMEASEPGDAHAMLAEKLAGEWHLDVKMWMGPGEPTTSTATSKSKMILDGRYLMDEVEGEVPGFGPIHGYGITGFDNASGKFRSVWFDNFGTGFMIGEGTFDETTNTLTITAKHMDPLTKAEKKVREVIRFEDDGTHVYESYEKGPDGSEMKSMEIVYTRKG